MSTESKTDSNEKTHKLLGEENVGTLMRKYAVPCIISLLVGAVYYS